MLLEVAVEAWTAKFVGCGAPFLDADSASLAKYRSASPLQNRFPNSIQLRAQFSMCCVRVRER